MHKWVMKCHIAMGKKQNEFFSGLFHNLGLIRVRPCCEDCSLIKIRPHTHYLVVGHTCMSMGSDFNQTVRIVVTRVKRHTAVTICDDYWLEVLNFIFE